MIDAATILFRSMLVLLLEKLDADERGARGLEELDRLVIQAS
jgi:hypothetical protein